MKRIFFSTLSKIAHPVALLLQLTLGPIALWSQAAKNIPDAPTHVQATDGVFTDRIDVSWTKDDGSEYRIYRGTTPSVSDMKEVSRQWHSFNYFSDRTRLDAGKRYFYRVKARKNGRLSSFSNPDEGFTQLVAGGRKIMDKTDNLNPNDTILPIEITVNKLVKDSVKTGEYFDISYALLNKNKGIVQNIALYFYLSTDALLDKEDILLDVAPLDPLSIDRLKRGAIGLHIAPKTARGDYFILIKLEPSTKIIAKKIFIQ